MLRDLRAFAFGGSLVDLAIGIAIGAAFAGVVDSLVKNVILPLVADLVGSPNVNGLHASIRGKARIEYGTFLTDFIAFLLLAFVILLAREDHQAPDGRGSGGGAGRPGVRPLHKLHPARRERVPVLHPRRGAVVA